MLWRRLSLSGKLFAAVASVALLVLALVAGAVALNMRAGFSYYLIQTEMGRLVYLADALTARDDAADGWTGLRDEAAWQDFIQHYEDMNGPPPPPPRPQWEDGQPAFPPPPPPHLPGNLAGRLHLVDAAGRHVAGPRPDDGPVVSRALIAAGGTPLGALQLQAPLAAAAPADRVFVREQLRILALVTVMAMGLAAVVAWLLARQFVAPIRDIGLALSRLAGGDYAQRLPVDRSDELGTLMQDHNALAQSLEASRRREREWLSNASHELKTPLAVLRAEIEALQDGVRTPTPAILAGLHCSTMRLSRLVTDINILAAGEELALISTSALHRLDDLAAEAAQNMRGRAESLGLQLSLTSAGPVWIRGDAERLQQVLDNLLDNACRYTEAPGRIAIHVDAAGPSARLRISDTAPCPPPYAIPHLFDRFYRLESSRSRRAGGSGLGLAICRSLIARHGGTIDAAPSVLGGLALTLTLPLAGETDDG